MRGKQAYLRTWLPRLLLGCLVLHFCTGVLPFAPFEGDDLGVVRGLESKLAGTDAFAEKGYLYPIQPGSYHVLFYLVRLTGSPPIALFGVFTAIGAAMFIALASMVISRVSGVRLAWVAIALLFSQELVAEGCYANTTAPAGAFAMGGLLLAQRANRSTELWLAGVLMGLGAWLRLDCLLLSPAVLALRLATASRRIAVRDTVLVALSCSLTLGAIWYYAGPALTDAWSEFYRRDAVNSWSMLLQKGPLVLGFTFTLVCVVAFCGLLWRQEWSTLTIAISGSLLSFIVYGGNFSSPKYFYYAAPFLLLPALVWLARLLAYAPGTRPWIGGTLISLAICTEAVVGVQSSSGQFRRYDPAPLASPFRPNVGAYRIIIGIGEGEIIPTDDGPRMRGAQFWAPRVWHREKRAMTDELRRLSTTLQSMPPNVIVTSTYLSFRVTDHLLQMNGYITGPRSQMSVASGSFVMETTSHDHHIRLYLINHSPTDVEEFEQATATGGRTLFINDRGGIGFRHLVTLPASWKLLSPHENLLVTIYEGGAHRGPLLPLYAPAAYNQVRRLR